MSKEELKIPPVFECFAKFVNLDNSRVEIIPTHSYIAENGRVEFTFKIPNSYFGDQSKQIADLEAKLAERGKEIAIRNQKLNELKTELHKRDESLQRKKQQVGDVHKAVKQAKKESARKGRQVCYANNEVVQYQKQIKQLKQQLAEKDEEIENINKEWVQSIHDWKEIVKKKDEEIALLEEHDMIFHNQLAIEQLEKLRKHYCHLMWDGRSASDSWVIQECVDLLDKELKQLTHQHEDKGE